MAREKKFSTEDMYMETHKLLLSVGYDKFSFGLLATSLKVSRAAIYKYYTNKDELIYDYMVSEMEKMIEDLNQIEWISDYPSQFQQLFALIFEYGDIHQISFMVPNNEKIDSIKIREKKQQSLVMHKRFFEQIQQFIQTGQDKGYIKQDIPIGLIIELIFHSVTIPNRSKLTQQERASFLQEIICQGIFENKVTQV